VPLNELRFEAASSQIGGGLVFNLDGSLMGVLGATLGITETNRAEYQDVAKALGGTGTRSGGAGGGGFTLPRASAPALQFGPAPQTVAYSVSSTVLQRVVTGLMSPSRKVIHPAIGVFCRDAGEPGAEVESIQPDSPAEKAGIQPGDVITSIGGSTVRNQVDVARITMRLRIGTTIEVRFKRAGQAMTANVMVGSN
jgi:S1-C subfamily serine protease